VGKFMKWAKIILVVTISGGVGFTLAGFLLRDWDFSWDWTVAAQPLATLGASIIGISAASLAWLTGRAARKQEKEIHEEKTRREHEYKLREKFSLITEMLATDNFTKRESGIYMLAALANEWKYFHKDNPHDALTEQQICLNMMIQQLKDEINEDPAPELFKFKEMVQHTIITGLEKDEEEVEDFELDFRHCHFYNMSISGIFKDVTLFDQAHFHGNTFFNEADFKKIVSLDGAIFHGDIFFNNTTFCETTAVGAQFLSLSKESIEAIKFLKKIDANFDGAVFNISFSNELVED